MATAARHEILLLGEQCARYGDYTIEVTGDGRIAGTLSVGADEHSPSRRFKADPSIPNEDALLIISEGSRVLLAVADAHFGHQSSHVLLQRLAEGAVPASLETLQEAVIACGDEQVTTGFRSETTLLAAVLDRTDRRLFGVSYGDSTLIVLGADEPRPVTIKTSEYVTPLDAMSLAPEWAETFELKAPAGALVCAFTDGLDECHYRSPETSVRPAHMQRLFAEVGARPEPYARRLTELALAGVDGHPGGQDNIALVVAAA